MFRCKFCCFASRQLKLYQEHRIYHSNLTKKYWCGFNGCPKSFHQLISLRSHLRRIHNIPATQTVHSPPRAMVRLNRNAKCICSIELCRKECDNRYSLIKHLKSHIAANEVIKCPHYNCDKKYNRLNSFTSHLPKNHKSAAEVTDGFTHHEMEEDRSNNDTNNSMATRVSYFDDDDADDPDIGESIIESISALDVPNGNQRNSCTDPFLLKIAQLYLKLECQFLLPSVTIQHIVSESFGIHGLNQHAVKDTLRMRLVNQGLNSDNVAAMLEDVFQDDPFSMSFKILNTIYKRRKFYKEKFGYVEPIEVVIKENGSEKTFFHYVPIEETLKQVLSDRSLRNEFKNVSDVTEPDVLSDFTDGSLFRQSTFFKQNPESFQLILYQDSFEVVNPLGSAVQKHRILAIYMSIGNLNSHTRSHVTSIKLVALCKEKEFDHKKVYGRITEDLKKLEDFGMELSSGKIIKGAVVFIAGDNLGSHQLGGFVENFSTATYFCRYCVITRDKLQDEKYLMTKFEARSIESYNRALEKIGDQGNYEGIKFDSIFNSLAHYHVCSPGLPPCLGHDLMEGIIAYDLKLYIDQLEKRGWFSYETLNKRINSFPYSNADRRDRPCTVSQKKKRIVGGAWQIWIFLKLFPLLIADKIKDANNEIWHCFLLLTEIIEIVCAPNIHKSYLPYLSTIITEYLALRLRVEPNLRPKHHYLLHYPELIVQFGPLIRVWTMRFESKHTYFKRALRFSRNYINVTKSMSEKHELFQSLLRSGADIRSNIEMKGNSPFDINLYSEAIKNAVKNIQQTDLQQCDEIVMKGLSYKRGNALFLHQTGYQCKIEVGRISILLCDEENAFALCEVLETIFLPRLRAFKVGLCVRYECVPLNDSLPSKEALQIYKVENMLCVKPNHGLVRRPL